MASIDIIVPIFNELPDLVTSTVRRLADVFDRQEVFSDVCIILVDDGSDEPIDTSWGHVACAVHVVRHHHNLGYGQAIKTGIRSGSADWLLILDADGTYSPEEVPLLLSTLEGADMVVGIRTGPIREIPLMRRLPKLFLNWFASFVSGRHIVDLNSGMRIFSRQLAYHLWGLFPSGFSFTSTLTMGAYIGGFIVSEVPISYHKRFGRSSIRPVVDTVRFFQLVARLGLLFNPGRLFTPIGSLLVGAGMWKGLLVDYAKLGYIGNFALILTVSGVQILMMGVLARILVMTRDANLVDPPRFFVSNPNMNDRS